MPSPITPPFGATGTNCLAESTAKVAVELMPVSVNSFSASAPETHRLVMWWDWSNSTAVCCQAVTSRRKLVNSDGTTG